MVGLSPHTVARGLRSPGKDTVRTVQCTCELLVELKLRTVFMFVEATSLFPCLVSFLFVFSSNCRFGFKSAFKNFVKNLKGISEWV